MKVLITGSDGFIGKNVYHYLKSYTKFKISTFNRNDKIQNLKKKILNCDFIIHLAGENRPKNDKLFFEINTDLTNKLCKYVVSHNKKIPIIFSSSIRALDDSSYGRSKFKAELLFQKLHNSNNNPVYIFRLPNIFGKWSRPNYNSVVSTFCYNISNDLPIKIDDKNKILNLLYIDDLIIHFMNILKKRKHIESVVWPKIKPVYNITVGELANKIIDFNDQRKNNFINNVGKGLNRALYSTFMSFTKPINFSTKVQKNQDSRGVFVEMLKNNDSGQFSFFTSKPGVIRGEHFHNTKTEKFLIVKGEAKFLFKNLITNEISEILASDKNFKIIDTIPGWIHSIENIGDCNLIGLIWANEVFDKKNPDTIMVKE